NRRADQHLVVVRERRPVPAAHLGNHEELAALFDLAVRHAGGAAEIRAPDFEPHDVVRVVGDAHLVGFLVADARAALDETLRGHVGTTLTAEPFYNEEERLLRTPRTVRKLATPLLIGG